MKLYLTTIPNLPGWKAKIRTHWRKGSYIASVTLPIDTGMVTLNEEDLSEHQAVHRVITSLTALVAHVNFPANNRIAN